MFRGATKVTLDDKGRMVMPTRYREAIAQRAQGKVVVTVDRDQCLLIYPQPDWEQVEQKLMSLPSLHAQSRRLQRLMVGHATDLELDGHGRFLVPPELRQFDRSGKPLRALGRNALERTARFLAQERRGDDRFAVGARFAVAVAQLTGSSMWMGTGEVSGPPGAHRSITQHFRGAVVSTAFIRE